MRKNLRIGCANEQDYRVKLQDYFNQNKDKLQYILSSSYFHQYNTGFHHLRKLHKFQSNTPLHFLTEYYFQSSLQLIGPSHIQKVILSEQHFPEILKYLVIDENNAVPYYIIEPVKSKVQKKRTICIVILDWFETFTEYIQYFVVNCSNLVVMLNLPGQAYTVYNPAQNYDNFYHAQIVDQMIFELEKQKIVNTTEDCFKLLGVGYGAFVLSTFAIGAYGYLPHLTDITVINTFLTLDEQLNDTINKSIKIFQQCQAKGYESLAFKFYSGLVNSCPLNDGQIEIKKLNNPITCQGRITLLNSVLNKVDIVNRFQQFRIGVKIIQSMKDSLISIEQSDLMLQEKKNEYDTSGLKKTKKREINWWQGNHDLLENIQQLESFLSSYLNE